LSATASTNVSKSPASLFLGVDCSIFIDVALPTA
jgi:hypothetical protein